MADLSVKIAGVEFGNPLIAASGTFGFGKEYGEFYPLSALGGISCKGIIFNHCHPGDVMEEDNRVMCEYMTGLKVLAFVKDGDRELEIDGEVLKGLYE